MIHDPSQKRAARHDAWLDQFPPRYRGTLGSPYYNAVRAGVIEPAQVLVAVRDCYLARMDRADAAGRDLYRRAIVALVRDLDAALRFATHAVAREALPDPERRRLKEEARQRGVSAVLEEKEAREP